MIISIKVEGIVPETFLRLSDLECDSHSRNALKKVCCSRDEERCLHFIINEMRYVSLKCEIASIPRQENDIINSFTKDGVMRDRFLANVDLLFSLFSSLL